MCASVEKGLYKEIWCPSCLSAFCPQRRPQKISIIFLNRIVAYDWAYLILMEIWIYLLFLDWEAVVFLAGQVLCLSSWEGHHDPGPDLNHDPDPDPDYGRAILLIQDSSSLPSLSFFRLHLTSSWWVKGRLWKKSTLIYFAPSPSAAWMCWLFYAHRIWQVVSNTVFQMEI